MIHKRVIADTSLTLSLYCNGENCNTKNFPKEVVTRNEKRLQW